MSGPYPDSWPAPAKINLFLRVVGRRPDGYHLLQTVFQFLDYGDAIRVTPRDDGAIRLTDPIPGVPEHRDLAVRAAALLKQVTGVSLGADISVEKHLPMGAGLGGGSSDAATTLLALNRLWELNLPEARLAELGLQLGADVPVFVHGRAGWAEGVGERLTPLDLPEPWYVVVVPPCHVSTAEIFAAPELTRNAPPLTIAAFLSGAGGNDCEAVVCRRHPEVGRALAWLSGYAPARMSGTGSAVFAAFADEALARGVAGAVPAPWAGLTARGCNRSPLHERMTKAT
jgi:4-diphosphocytidyl-2-C-methyl-D-erythritol kinase